MMNLKRTYSYISVTLKALEKKKNNKRYFWLIKMYSSGSCYVHIFNLALSVTSVAQSCLTLCDPMDCSMPGFPVHHQLLEFVQTHVHRVSDAIQPSHPLSSTSPTFSLSQHQGLFQWVSSSHQVAKVLKFQHKHHHQSFPWIFRTDSH